MNSLPPPEGACGSVEERFPHTEEVAGSIPATPIPEGIDATGNSLFPDISAGEWLSW
jgi:hypothetical protein